MKDIQWIDIHLFLSGCQCDNKFLVDPECCISAIINTVAKAGLQYKSAIQYAYSEGGITVGILLAESHVMVHSWPEINNSVVVDISVCNYTFDNSSKALLLSEYIRDLFQPEHHLFSKMPGFSLAEGFDLLTPSYYERTLLDVEKIISQTNSCYQAITLLETKNFGKVLILDNVFQTSENDGFFYHEPLVHIPLLTHSQPSSVLVVGGGDGGVVCEVIKHKSVIECTLVEIDQKVIEISKEHLYNVHKGSLDSPIVKVIIDDGAKFLENTFSKFDVIILDLTDPGGVSESLYKAPFYTDVRDKLKPNGLACLHIGAITYNPDASREIFKTLQKVFSYVFPFCVYVPLYGSIMAFALCGKDSGISIPSSIEIEQRMVSERLKNLSYLNPEVFVSLFALPNYVKEILYGTEAANLNP